MSPAEPLRGRVALVTGASRRIAIGAAVTRRLVADGAAVLIHSWSPHDADQPWGDDPGGPGALVAELRSQGGRVEHVAADFADPDAPARVVDAARNAFGHLDVVVANHARSSDQTLEELTVAEISLSYAVNTAATLLLVKAYAAQHDGRLGGRVMLFTSGQYPRRHAIRAALCRIEGSTAPAHGQPRRPPHAPGHHGQLHQPGPNDTGYADANALAALAARSPSGRWGRPVDAARHVAWLASDEADWVTGQVIASDGGWSTSR